LSSIGQGLTAARVRKEFGQGRTVTALDAVRLGMADRVFPTTTAALNFAATYRLRELRASSELLTIEHSDDPDARFVALERLKDL
jgi:hypothetical protein